MSHPRGEMFSKNRQNPKMQGNIVPFVSATPFISKTCDADRSGAHGTRKL